MDDFGQAVKRLISQVLTHNEMKFHTVDYRVKSEESARKKIDSPGNAHSSFASLHDLLGLRITCYFADEVDRIADLIEREFNCDEKRSVNKGAQLGTKEFGYRSVHRVAKVSDARARMAEYAQYKSLRFEVQIRTVVQHAWAEIEHDLGYKAETIPEPMSRRFSMLAGVLELVDFEFQALRDELNRYEIDANRAAKERSSEMTLDRTTLDSMLKYDQSLRELDLSVARTVGAELFTDIGPDSDSLDERLAELHAVGIDSIEDLRSAVELWKTHVMALAPRWLMRHHFDRDEAEPARDITIRFGVGVGLFYLCLAIGAQASRTRDYPQFKLWSSQYLRPEWARTLRECGPAPQLPLQGPQLRATTG